MTQKDEKLLLKDLCARLPYGVILDVDTTDWKEPQGHIKVKIEDLGILCKDMSLIVNGSYYGKKYKPYLRPMSSMTEEECDMVEEILGDKCIFDFMSNGDIVLKQGRFSQNKLAKLHDYYNSIHVDYQGLIPKGLAIEVTEENNPYEN